MSNNLSRICFFIVFVLLFISEETLLFGTSDIVLLKTIGKFIGFEVFLPLAFLCWYYKKEIKIISFFFLVMMTFWLLLTSLLRNDDYNVVVMEISLMSSAVLFISICDYNMFRLLFVRIMIFLGIASLSLYVFQSLFYSLTHMLPSVSNYLGYKYNTIGIASLIDTPYLFRGMSIFREPGVFAFFLCMAIYFELEKEKKNIFNIVILFVSMYTTFSTTGYICAFLFIAYHLIQNKIEIKYFALVSLITLFLLNSNETIFFIWNKIESENGSYISRVGSVTANFEMLKLNPLIGIGEYKASSLFEQMTLESLGKHAYDNTNSFLLLFASYGLFYGLICFVSWLRLFVYEHKKKSILVFFSFFLLLSSEIMIHNIIFYIMLFYGLSIDGENKHEYYGNKHC